MRSKAFLDQIVFCFCCTEKVDMLWMATCLKGLAAPNNEKFGEASIQQTGDWPNGPCLTEFTDAVSRFSVGPK